MRSALLLFLTFHFSLLTSSARSIQTINAEKAREVAREQVIWQDRLCPFSTFALDFLKSVYGKSNYKGLTPEQVVYGWLLRPEVWKDEPMIHIPETDLQRQLNIDGEYAKFSELFDDTLGYKLNTLGSDLPERMRQMARESSAAISLDEKVGDIILLTRGRGNPLEQHSFMGHSADSDSSRSPIGVLSGKSYEETFEDCIDSRKATRQP